MYDVHVGDRFSSKEGDAGTSVVVVMIDIDGRIKYEFDGSGARRWADRETFLRRFPVVE